MVEYLFRNNAASALASSASNAATNLVLGSGHGDRFPQPDGPDEAFVVAISDVLGSLEYCLCTGRSGDTLTVVRAQEGTVALSWASGSLVELRLTAAALDSFVQRGNLDLGDLTLKIANLEGTTGVKTPKLFNGVNQLTIGAASGDRPRINNSVILTVELLSKCIFTWTGNLVDLPSHFKLCDGTLDTPDLRDRFIIGASADHPMGSTGGTTSVELEGIEEQELEVVGIEDHVFNVSSRDYQGSGGSAKALWMIDSQDNPGDVVLEHAGGTVTVPAHTHDVNMIPPYYALAFVMLNI